MSKESFHDNAKSPSKETSAGKTGIASTNIPNPFLMPLTPKPPFGMPVMPVAKNLKVLPQAVKTAKEDMRVSEHDEGEKQ